MESNFKDLELDELQEINGGKGNGIGIGYVVGKVIDAAIDMATNPRTVLDSGVPSKRPI